MKQERATIHDYSDIVVGMSITKTLSHDDDDDYDDDDDDDDDQKRNSAKV